MLMKIFNSRDEWLQARNTYIGGSDAATIIGLNPYKSNVELWMEKTGRKEPEDISNKPYVQYGTEAEKYLRELFKLDFPEYKMEYSENNMWLNDKYPFAHASLDGWLTDKDGRKGVWECKTSNILSQAQHKKWQGCIPNQYFVQVLHYLMVTEFDFAIVKAQLRFEWNDDVFLKTEHYKIERSNVKDDIAYLAEMERKFWESIKSKKRPTLILPEV